MNDFQNLNQTFVCQWDKHDFIDDEDESYDVFISFGFTHHSSLGEAQSTTLDSSNYFKLTNTENSGREYLCCTTILVYENNLLIGKYIPTGYTDDYWRYYEFKEHWLKMYPQLISFPPQIK